MLRAAIEGWSARLPAAHAPPETARSRPQMEALHA
jgi:hypothetical protein